jgi:hypothetical protein
MNVKSHFKYLSFLDEIGYLPAPSSTNQIVYNSIKKTLEWKFGKSVSTVLINNMCSLYRLAENELLTNYDLFETLLNQVFNDKSAVDTILNWIKREMLIQIVLKDSSSLNEWDILNPNLTIKDIISDIGNLQVFEFIRKIPAHEHIVFLYNNEESKDKALSAFFDSAITGNSPRGLISVESNTSNTNLKLNSNILYEELFLSVKMSSAMKRMFDWINSLYSSSNTLNEKEKEEHDTREEEGESKITRVAGDDATWFFRNGLGNEILLAEKSIGKCIQENISVLCMYNISKMPDLQIMKTIMATHSYVILDSPFIVYKSAGT